MFSGVARLTPISSPLLPSKAPRSKAPSLHRHYPASTVVRASPTPTSTAARNDCVEGHDPSSTRVSHVAQRAFLTCHSHYPGGPGRVRMLTASPPHAGLPRYPAGSAPTTCPSRPAQDSLALRPVRLPAHPRWTVVPEASTTAVASRSLPGSYRAKSAIARAELSSAGSLPLVAHRIGRITALRH